MRPPVEHVRVSSKARDIMMRVKRKTGLQHWNEICRVAFCRSISNPTPVKIGHPFGESAVEMDWRTFARPFEEIYSALVSMSASRDGIDLNDREALADYFRAHLERGISSCHDVQRLEDLVPEEKT